jgi:hypothetical protein
MLYFALRAFGFLITNINIKITISLFFLSSSIFFHPSPCRLRSIFLPVPFSFSLSFRRMCSIFSLSSRHLLHLLSLFFFLPIPVLSLLIPTSATRYHFPLSHTFSPLPIVLRFSYSLSPLSLTYLSLCPSTFFLLYFDSLILYYLSASLSLYLFIHLLLVHFLAGSSSYSLLLLANFLQFFLFLIPSKPVPVYLYFTVSYFHLFSSISLLSGQLS